MAVPSARSSSTARGLLLVLSVLAPKRMVYPGSMHWSPMHWSPMRRAVCALLVCLSSFAWAQGVHPVSGRQYANVMGVGGADWLVRPERESEEQPDKALDALAIAKGA